MMALAHWQTLAWFGSALFVLGILAAKPSAAEEPAPHAGIARYEIRFLQNMIDHHQMAVVTSMLCQERAVHDDLRRLCEGIEATQTAEIEQMQAWLSEWYGIEYEPEMSRRMEREMMMLAELEGEDFEIAFMEMMIEHHAGAITSGERCVMRAYHAELIELCENIVITQQMEIKIMEDWLCDWYDICE